MQNAARPSGALVYNPRTPDGADSLTNEQRQKLREELAQYYTQSRQAGQVMILEGGLDWREMSLSPRDMDWLAGREVAARDIALAFHVPPQLVGVDGSLTYANFEQARLALYDDAILPMLDLFRDALNQWLSVKYGPEIYLDYDKDQIDALAPRREKIWQKITKADFLTINEKRQMVGLPPLQNGGHILEDDTRSLAAQQMNNE